MREYKTARTIFGFMEFLSWALVAVGLLVAIGAAIAGQSQFGRNLSSAAGLVAMLPGLTLCLVGVISVMVVQIGRATVDTAEMTGKMLKNSDEELAILKAEKRELAARLGGSGPIVPTASAKPSLDARAAEWGSKSTTEAQARTEPASEPKITTYKGLSIKEAGMGVSVNGKWFKTEAEARAKIDVGEVPMIGEPGKATKA